VTEPKVVCVFGISGVGKSTIIRHAMMGSTTWRHFQASKLIKIGLEDELLSSETLRRASGDQILGNQLLLVESFWRAVGASRCDIAILDGHLVVDADDGLVKIPVGVIERLKPSKLVHIEDRPEEIHYRREADVGRVRPIRTPEILAIHQAMSAQLCGQYARELEVPVHFLGPPDFETLIDLLHTT
jgi:adenylate kinase